MSSLPTISSSGLAEAATSSDANDNAKLRRPGAFSVRGINYYDDEAHSGDGTSVSIMIHMGDHGPISTDDGDGSDDNDPASSSPAVMVLRGRTVEEEDAIVEQRRLEIEQEQKSRTLPSMQDPTVLVLAEKVQRMSYGEMEAEEQGAIHETRMKDCIRCIVAAMVIALAGLLLFIGFLVQNRTQMTPHVATRSPSYPLTYQPSNAPSVAPTQWMYHQYATYISERFSAFYESVGRDFESLLSDPASPQSRALNAIIISDEENQNLLSFQSNSKQTNARYMILSFFGSMGQYPESWSNKSNVCDWKGIICENQTDTVQTIDFGK